MNIEKERKEFEAAVGSPPEGYTWDDDFQQYKMTFTAVDQGLSCGYSEAWFAWQARAEKAEAEFTSSIDAINERSRLRVENDELRALISDAAQSLCEQVRMPNIEHVADDHNDAVRAIRAAAQQIREQSND